MDGNDIDHLFEIRNRALELLKRLDSRAATDPSVLSEEVVEALHTPTLCAAWLAERRAELPEECLPRIDLPDEIDCFAQMVSSLLAVAMEIATTVPDPRIERKVRRRVVPRPLRTDLRPESRTAMKAYLSRLAQAMGLTPLRAEIDEMVGDMRWPLRAALVYCACADAALCRNGRQEDHEAARALWAELPARARHTLCARDYTRYLQTLTSHLRVAFKQPGPGSAADVRD
jgi:hypothetical protein